MIALATSLKLISSQTSITFWSKICDISEDIVLLRLTAHPVGNSCLLH
jgi:hypothetical protein